MSREEPRLSCSIFDIWWDSTGLEGFLGVWPSGGLGGDDSGTGLGEVSCLEGEGLPPDIVPERS